MTAASATPGCAEVVGHGPVRRHVDHSRAGNRADDPVPGVAADVVQDDGRVGMHARWRSTRVVASVVAA
jgi:hypothetical protein